MCYPYSPYGKGNVKMFHKISRLPFRNFPVFILVASKESPGKISWLSLIFSNILKRNVNSLGDDWLCEVQKLLEINFLVDVTVKVEISTSCNTISRIFLKCHTLKLILKNINKQASLMRPRRALNMKVTNNANEKKIMPTQKK